MNRFTMTADRERVMRFLLQANVPSRVICHELIGASEARLKSVRKALDLPAKVGQAPVPATMFSTIRGRLEAGILIHNYRLVARTETGLWRRVDLMAMVATLRYMKAIRVADDDEAAAKAVQKLTPDHAHCVLAAYASGQIEFHKCTHRLEPTAARCGLRYPVLSDVLPYPAACPFCEKRDILSAGPDKVKLPTKQARNSVNGTGGSLDVES